MAICRAAILAALLFVAITFAAAAEDVTLTSRDGSVEISGTLLGYDGEFYRVDTIYGVLTVDGTGVSCAGPGCPNLDDFIAEITLSGAASMGEVLMPALVESFASSRDFTVRREIESNRLFSLILTERTTDRTVMRVHFRITNSDEGFADLVADEADIAMARREIRPDEARLAEDAGLGDLRSGGRSRIVALDAIVPIVSPGAGLGALSLETLGQIVAGEIDNWSDLGGPDEPIALHVPVRSSGMMQAFTDTVLAPAALQTSPAARRHRTRASLADAVSEDPFAIGLASYSETGRAEAVPLGGPCGFRNIATPLSLKTEDYPLTVPLFLYLPPRRLAPLVRAFLADLSSLRAAVVIRRAGFVDQRLVGTRLNAQGQRLANALEAAGDETGLDELKRLVRGLRATERLSISFRFEGGSSDLDAQSRANVDLLGNAVARGEFDGRRLIFAGFSDGDGPAAGNLRLARTRAETIREAVKRAANLRPGDGPRMAVDAFGEAMPLACDDSDWGRRINRRVEVWLD